ncbi:universal stress protein UspA [Rubrobacter taiwanensis]|jgi:nucleotide-binding universal stress UspA family protein/rubrerythrin|uniref:Universal stress protein UspA n=1 Tax=Rubrobacter taiwanensis TaxID=185139 RepID=A0A4R1BRA4_9ACTN|nr:universal stress protein [Rubrobacter taiwanensis]TCJ20293.1 universal stress protein UspA [Rubrobacter taiwanensis]
MYREIYVPVDNSDYSNQASVIGVEVARRFGGRVAGCHAYAAKMHDVRFRQMESGLPEEFRDEEEMKRQRKIHDQLITKGLEIITDSYIDVLEPLCEKYDIELVRRSLEGKNFKVIVEDVNNGPYDLVVMGAMGMAAVKDTVLGSVTERVARRLKKADLLIVKDLDRMPFDHILVTIDGSAKSLGALKRAIELAKAFDGYVEAVSVFDPYFHYAMFHSIAGVLSAKAQKVFRFKEQEKLHEEIIDSGLAKIYTAHLEVARKVAADEGVELKTTLLAGKPFEQVLKYTREVEPTLVMMGRIGYHSDDDMDIGSNAENMMRYLPTNVMVGNYEYQAPDLYTAAEHMTWTKEALERMDRVPGFVVGMATGAILRYAIEKGYTVITESVIDEVIENILPPGAMESMRAVGEEMRRREAAGEDASVDSLFQDFTERTASGGNGHRENGASEKDEILNSGRGGFGKAEDQGDIAGISEEVRSEIDRAAQGKDRYECEVCNYVAKGKPVKCPVCGAEAIKFRPVDREIARASDDENLNRSEVYDGRELLWTDDAKRLLDTLDEWQVKRRVRARAEKSALKKGYTTVTREYVEQCYREETGRDYYETEVRLNTEGNRVYPQRESGGCPVSHARQKVEQETGEKCPVDHKAFKQAGEKVPEGGSKQFAWTEDAVARLERVPKGFMRNISRNMTENLAREKGVRQIDLPLIEEALEGARNTMEDVITGKISIAELARDTGETISSEEGEAPHPTLTVTMVCTVCGEESEGIQPPEECEVCGAPAEDFEVKQV